MAKTTLYVGNIPDTFSSADLVRVFEGYGCTRGRVVKGKGIGFVEVHVDSAARAVRERNEVESDGCRLIVHRARDGASKVVTRN